MKRRGARIWPWGALETTWAWTSKNWYIIITCWLCMETKREVSSRKNANRLITNRECFTRKETARTGTRESKQENEEWVMRCSRLSKMTRTETELCSREYVEVSMDIIYEIKNTTFKDFTSEGKGERWDREAFRGRWRGLNIRNWYNACIFPVTRKNASKSKR